MGRAPSSTSPPPAQGSAFFLGGLALVVWGWAIVGMAVEAYGFWLLFAGFFPTVLSFLRRIPVLGSAVDLPMLKSVRRRHRPGGETLISWHAACRSSHSAGRRQLVERVLLWDAVMP